MIVFNTNGPAWSVDADSTVTAKQLVEDAVQSAPNYYAGEIETLKAEVRKLTELVAVLASTLPAQTQLGFVKAFYPEAEPASISEILK